MWLLGKHRLMCGNSTNIIDVQKLVNGNKIDMIYTDPPYGIQINTSTTHSGKGIAKRAKYNDILNDQDTNTARECYNLIHNFFNCLLVYWGANYYDFLPPSKCWIAWFKRQGLPDDDFCGTELAYTNSSKHSKTLPVQWKGMIKEGEMGVKRVHPTQKPIKLALDCFEYLNANNNILDLFGGSGSTLIACEKSNRKCFMMELDAHYCDVIITRWEKLTGQKAILEAA